MKQFLLYISFTIAAFTATAQPGEDGQPPKKAEKIRALYVAYISQQLQFTPEEAEKFWPLHTQFESELQSVHRSQLNDLDKQQKMLDIKKKYQPGFGRIIGGERSNNFYRQHDQFREKLTRRLQEMRQNRNGGGGMKPHERGGGMKRKNGPAF
ncbi:MAG: hypothetical protein WKF88_00860 [Ferruginibacter sp.]